MQTVIQEKFSSIPSTHLYALQKRELEKGRIYCIVAESQSEGIGRRGSVWCSPKGNLYCSMILDNARCKGQVNQALAYSILKILQHHDIETQFKWPNDLLYRGKKICGVLSQHSKDRCVLSFGLNVNTPLKNRACMAEIRQETFDLDLLVGEILDELLSNLDFSDSNIHINELRKHLAYKNQIISYEFNQRVCRAKLLDIDADGSLVVEIQSQAQKLRCASNIRCDSGS